MIKIKNLEIYVFIDTALDVEAKLIVAGKASITGIYNIATYMINNPTLMRESSQITYAINLPANPPVLIERLAYLAQEKMGNMGKIFIINRPAPLKLFMPQKIIVNTNEIQHILAQFVQE